MLRTAPVTALVGNLVWGTDAVWACWEVAPSTYRHLSDPGKLRLREHLRAALLSIPGDALLAGVVEPWPWASLADAVGTDHPRRQRRELAEAQLAAVDDIDLLRRRFVLAVALPSERRSGWSRFGSSWSTMFGVTPSAPSSGEVSTRRRQADALAGRLGRCLPLTAATPGLIRWLYARVTSRGLVSEPSFDPAVWNPRMTGRRGHQVTVGLAGLWDCEFWEGGDGHDPDRPRHRRFVRVDGDDGPSYQSYACVADMPAEWEFPDGLGEWLHHLDEFEFPVEWALRIRSVDNQAAQRAVTKHARELQGQIDQYEADPAGAPPALLAAIDANDDERAVLSANPAERELRVTTIVSVAAPDLATSEARAAALHADFASRSYGLPRPTGEQVELMAACLPGSRTPRVCNDYQQYLLAGDLASAAPCTTDRVGHDSGLLLGVTTDSGLTTPVLIEPAYGPSHDRSGCIGLVGQPGSGKSYTLKRMATSVVAAGGQFVTLDRTPMGEYVRLAHHLADELDVTVQVVEIGAERSGTSRVMLDPLQVFGRDDRESLAIGFLNVITGYEPRSTEGATIDEAVRTVAARGGVLADVVDELERLDAGEVARRVRQLTRGELGTLAFGTDGEQLDLAADVIVFHAPRLTLPDRNVQTNAHLAAQMTVEHYESMGVLYLVTGAARTVCFSDQSRFSVFCVDEAWALRANLHGDLLITETANDSRKHNAAVWLGTPHPAQLLDGRLREYLPIRMVFSQLDGAGPAAAQFIGMTPTDGLTTMLCDSLTGGLGQRECLLRDHDGRIARIKVLSAETVGLGAAAETNPSKVAAADTAIAELATVRQVTAATSAAPPPDPPVRLRILPRREAV